MSFQAAELSIQLVKAIVPLMSRIKQRDKALADQLSRAASSISLNCAEAEFSDPGNRRARPHTAAGSAGETRMALRLAVAWRHVTAGDAQSALKLAERVVAILWKMTRGAGRSIKTAKTGCAGGRSLRVPTSSRGERPKVAWLLLVRSASASFGWRLSSDA